LEHPVYTMLHVEASLADVSVLFTVLEYSRWYAGRVVYGSWL